MWARVSRFKGPVESVEEDILDSKRRAEDLAGIAGSRGMYYLVDRASGEAMAVTLWESEQALRASEEQADRIRDESVRRIGGKIVDVKRYAVVIEPADLRGEAEERAA
jgi:heme-degrading monooxygenase HmoA